MEQMNDAKPPRHLSVIRHCASTNRLVDSSEQHGLDLRPPRLPPSLDEQCEFLPVFRSGSCSDIGAKPYMEDEHICIDDIINHLGGGVVLPAPGAFYGVFDGHGGIDAASFVRENLLKFIIEDHNFPNSVEKAMKSAFVMTDHAFADSPFLDCSSGTTALAALIFRRTMLIANAGDCRAVLGKRGRAIELSRDHKPNSRFEKLRIEKLGGMISDGYLNGQLSVSRALGDWHMKGPKGSACPLSAEPELHETILTEEDEFLIIGCDGLWDVMSSQYAVTVVRKDLMAHNDPARCSRVLVREALQRNSCDNLTAIVVCFSSNPPPRIEVAKPRVRRSISLEGLHLLKGFLDSNG
ncbi:probable protein phosphatase 2C 27 [Phalaenopsis equestris]|uniref:probable protein phosphatase 2C 27 n=1 Tax=Phalaenopsis equestris TaxID=78828 RepID=UPI0009E38396|nr:probable protein phosphatase 2C 27 [Phalaenopsis equestris]XP_020575121.1 probable protein phosphatase 2C 27 [Phalaenopsis equestris]XP_020575122.1 probable protein phosphatase 2C 27 [Phalaenopsis equestris]